MSDGSIKLATAFGTTVTLVMTLNFQSLTETVVFAALGATVSFCMSMVWKSIWNKWMKKK